MVEVMQTSRLLSWVLGWYSYIQQDHFNSGNMVGMIWCVYQSRWSNFSFIPQRVLGKILQLILLLKIPGHIPVIWLGWGWLCWGYTVGRYSFDENNDTQRIGCIRILLALFWIHTQFPHARPTPLFMIRWLDWCFNMVYQRWPPIWCQRQAPNLLLWCGSLGNIIVAGVVIIFWNSEIKWPSIVIWL